MPTSWQSGSPGSHGNLTVIDKVPQEMLGLVHAYWLQFPPMNPLWHSILGFSIAVFLIIALLGNICVIYIFTKTKSLRTPSNLLVVNLAVSDFMIMFTMGPPMVWNCYNETWMFGPLMCELYGMAGSLFGCISIWTMTMIAFDRYNVIVKGLSAKPMSHGNAILRIFFTWVASGIWTLLPLLGWSRFVSETSTNPTDLVVKEFHPFVSLVRDFTLLFPLFA